MSNFIKSNPGLSPRFNKYINFEDYNSQQLVEIFKLMCKKSQFKLNDGEEDMLKSKFDDIVSSKDMDFENCRLVRNIFEKVITNQANRVVGISNITKEDLILVNLEDLL
jgi:stage V sporulation protein K